MQSVAIGVWLAVASIGCAAAAPSKGLPVWRIDLWNENGDYLGAVVVEVTEQRSGEGQVGRILETPRRVDGIGREAEVRIYDGRFWMDLNLGVTDWSLVVDGVFQGSVASGEASGFVKLGTFKARRVS